MGTYFGGKRRCVLGPYLENRPVRFNVLVEELGFLGVLPARVGRLVLLIIVLSVGLFVGKPMLRQYLSQDRRREIVSSKK